jgi:hypothetical protein
MQTQCCGDNALGGSKLGRTFGREKVAPLGAQGNCNPALAKNASVQGARDRRDWMLARQMGVGRGFVSELRCVKACE